MASSASSALHGVNPNFLKKHFLIFCHFLLLLSGDISLNSGPCQMQFNDDKTWEPLKIWGLHFCHLNVNSLLSKIEELR